MPGRMRAQEIDRPAEQVSEPVPDLSPPVPVAVGAPPTVEALTAGGNGAMSRMLSGGGPGGPAAGGMSVDPLQSLLDGDEHAVPATPLTDTRVPDAPPDTGSDGAGGAAGAGGFAGAGGAAGAGGGPGAAGQVPAGGVGGPAPVADTAGPVAGPVVDTGGVHAGASGVRGDLPVLDQPAIDASLVDDELAEHERWGSAAATVGAAGSSDRAGWIAEEVGGGLGTGALTGAGAGLVLAMGTRGATRLAARRIPVPVVGAVIGGAIGALSLMGQLGAEGRAEIAARFGAIGEGASGYEVAANTIDGIVTGLDVAGSVLDTVGLIAGVIAGVAWALALPTFGASVAVATPATTIATAASAGSAVLGAVKMALQPLVLLFRALHTFTSEADPRAVQAMGGRLASDAGAVGGVLGGFAGTAVGNRASDRLGLPADPTRATRVEETAGTGGRASAHPAGPTVEAVPSERLVLTPDEIRVAEQMARNPNGTVLGADGQVAANGPLPAGLVPGTQAPTAQAPLIVDANGVPMRQQPDGEPALDLDDSAIAALLSGQEPQPGVARRVARTVQDDPRDPSTVRPRTRFDPDPTPMDIRVALGGVNAPTKDHSVLVDLKAPDGKLADLGYGHGHLVDVHGNEIPHMFGPYRGEVGRPAVDPVTGRKVWDPDATLHLPGTGDYAPEAAFAVRVGRPGSWADHVFDGDTDAARTAAMEHALARANAGDQAIASDSALPRGWMRNNPKQVPDPTDPIDAMNVYPIDPAAPRMVSRVAPQPEGLPAPDRPRVYFGGGPQVQLPYGTIPSGAKPVASFPVSKPPGPIRRASDAVLGGPIGTVDDAGDAARLASLVTGGGPDSAGAAPAAPVGPDQRRVEPVNPAYERPPGTPEQLAQMRREIGALLVSRSQADADADAARADRAETGRRADQLMSIASGVDDLGRRTDEQRSAVDSTAQANQQQQSRQGEAGTALGASASRLTGLATLEVLLNGWGAVTTGVGAVISLVSDSGGAKMNQLSADAARFVTRLEQAKMLVSGQNTQHPLQVGRLSGDAAAIGGEATRTTATGATIDRSGQQVDALAGQNTEDAAAAAEAEQRAHADSTEATGAASDVQARHDQLAADLAAWAQRHREQRQQAIEAARARLEAEGFEVTNASTW